MSPTDPGKGGINEREMKSWAALFFIWLFRCVCNKFDLLRIH